MRKADALRRYARKGFVVLRDEGILAVSIQGLQKVQKYKDRRGDVRKRKLIKFESLVDRKNVMRADWSNKPYTPGKRKTTPPYVINWVMSPPSSGGGHQNIFRFIEHLDKLGHTNNIYIYSVHDNMTLSQARENVRSYCSAQKMKFYRLGNKPMAKSDVVFATGWETAYPVFNEKTDAHKMYFVQDFEPYFYAMGTNYVLAENTYKFGFKGVTAGRFLAQKLSSEYGMDCDYYDFAASSSYALTNKSERKEVFFYARPVTERRGFDLGIMALELFHKAMPEYTINLAGWDVSDYDIPFPYVNHKTLQLSELPELYNRCAAALVISLTNMSLLPPELLACGAIPVVNEGPNNSLVFNNKYVAYVPASPAALAKGLIDQVRRKDLPGYSQRAARSLGSGDWSDAKDVFMKILEKELHGS